MFPILAADDKAYLDNAATSLMPAQVMEAMEEYEKGYRSNVARGIYPWAERATEGYEAARATVAKGLGTKEAEVIFTSGTTAALNMAAAFVGQLMDGRKGKVLVSEMEHHSNIVPWMISFGEKGGIEWVSCDDSGVLDLDAAVARLAKGDIAAVAITHASNVTGLINEVRPLSDAAHEAGALVVVDGAQYIPHGHIDPREDLGADFYAFSGHKCNGPNGIGVLWGRLELLNKLDPVVGGGGMVVTVGEDTASYVDPPHCFEPGTPNVAGAIGLGTALALRAELEDPSWEGIHEGLDRLDKMVLDELSEIDELRLFGPEETVERVPIRSFNLTGIHPHDVCQVLGEEGVFVRGGHHCAQPLMRRLGIDACVRVSLGPHVCDEDVSRLGTALKKAVVELG